MAIKAYYDGSGKGNDPSSSFMTLAGYTGTDLSWPDLQAEWHSALLKWNAPRSKRGSPYFHSTEAFVGNEGYSSKNGWNQENTLPLVTDLRNVLGARKRSDLIGSSCTVNLVDYRKVKSFNPNLPSAESICLDFCFGAVTLCHPERCSGGIEIFFDRGEAFYGPFSQAWKKKVYGKRTFWADLVLDIKQVDDMREVYGLQAADLLAWLANRYYTKGPEDKWAVGFSAMFILKANYHTLIDEHFLLDSFDQQGNRIQGAKWPQPSILVPRGTMLYVSDEPV